MPDSHCDISLRVKQTIVRALQLDVEPERLADDEALFGDGLADSIATLEIIFAIEAEFGIDVDDDDLRVELFASVRSLVDYVEARLAEPTPDPA
ncbi:MAG TPA: acyl carrier protein [Candidatus Latescibacteria bacterium]|nr:acyl carrier protein [Candidatus Latescibacterota bacterium]